MVARPASPYRSANAGEFSDAARGRVDIKQYYSGGLAYKNIEPVPQSGFRQMGGCWRKGYGRKPLSARSITSPTLLAGPHTGTQTVWTGTVAGTVAAVEVTGFEADAGTVSFTVEAEVAGVWTALTGAYQVGAAPVSRLAAFAPGAQPTATGLRIRATFSESAEVDIASVAAFFESGDALAPRYVALTTDEGADLSLFFTEGVADIFTDAGWRGAVKVPGLTAAMLPDIWFYAEARTIGVFHNTLETASLFLANPVTDHDWSWNLWAYDPPPAVDLGGVYDKTDDKWGIFLRWTGTPELFLSVTVNGESSLAIPHTDGVDPDAIPANEWDDTTWAAYAADLAAAIEALPGLGSGVTVTEEESTGLARELTVTFGGALSGQEYQLSAIVTNTADASALPYHTQVGKTEYEPLFSDGRGWPGGAELTQDRMCYYDLRAMSGAIALSRAAEYFDIDIDATADTAARLDRLRSQTSERILAVKDSRYLLVFSDRAAYFVNNRTIERNTPMNFVKFSEIGIAQNCKPFDLEGIDYYIGRDPNKAKTDPSGHQMLSVVYDDVSTSYNADPQSLLASHLVSGVIRAVQQKKSGDNDAAKSWQMRDDGRLIAAQLIRNQDIMGFCEWIAAHGGDVVEIGIDGRNRFWLSIRWGTVVTIQLYDTAIFLHDALSVTPDLAGVVSGLPAEWEGVTVHAVADGYELPDGYAVDGGEIDLEDAFAAAIVGRWQPPRWESMPQVYVTPGEDVVIRPGRIHTAHVNVIDTTSIAVGANGGLAQDQPLNDVDDPVDAPMPAKTRLVTVTGEDLTGVMTGTTMVITQTKPGKLRVRDLAMGVKL